MHDLAWTPAEMTLTYINTLASFLLLLHRRQFLSLLVVFHRTMSVCQWRDGKPSSPLAISIILSLSLSLSLCLLLLLLLLLVLRLFRLLLLPLS